MKNKTIECSKELRGILNLLIYQYDLHKRSIAEELGLGFSIKENVNSFTVTFNWVVGYKPCRPEEAAEALIANDWFTFLKDEGFSKLEQYVEDCLFKVAETNLNELAA